MTLFGDTVLQQHFSPIRNGVTLSGDLCIGYNGTLPARSEVVKDFTPECGGKTPRGAAPRGFPDTRGGKTFATEREGGVMSLP